MDNKYDRPLKITLEGELKHKNNTNVNALWVEESMSLAHHILLYDYENQPVLWNDLIGVGFVYSLKYTCFIYCYKDGRAMRDYNYGYEYKELPTSKSYLKSNGWEVVYV